MAVTQDEQAANGGQDVRIAYFETRLAHVLAMERDSRTLLQNAHAELFKAQGARQAAEARAAEHEARVAALEHGVTALRAELDRREAQVEALLPEPEARQAAEARVAQLEASIAELEGVAADLRIELSRRDARIKELKEWLDRAQSSLPGRLWRIARRLTP
jgi:uncharacterized coiled-coil protein SlyX